MSDEVTLPFRDTGYRVSEAGNVYSPSGRMLKPRPNQQGYLRIYVGRDEYVHRIVLIVFRGEPPSPFHEGDHENKNRADCRLSNLRWVLKKINLEQRAIAKGEAHVGAILTEEQVISIRRGPFYRGRDRILAAQFGVSRENIRDVRLGKKWGHIGGSQCQA